MFNFFTVFFGGFFSLQLVAYPIVALTIVCVFKLAYDLLLSR